MSYPDTITRVVVTGRYVTGDGSAAVGTVTFTPSVAPATPGAVLAAPLTVATDDYGRISVELLATDDPDWTPSGFTYLVTERIRGRAARSYSIAVPAAGGAVDLATVAPVAAVDEVSAYLLAVNDLADLDDPAAARANLGLTDPGEWVAIVPNLAGNVTAWATAAPAARLNGTGMADLSGSLEVPTPSITVTSGTLLGTLPALHLPLFEVRIGVRSVGNGSTGNTLIIGTDGAITFGASLASSAGTSARLPLDSVRYRTA